MVRLRHYSNLGSSHGGMDVLPKNSRSIDDLYRYNYFYKNGARMGSAHVGKTLVKENHSLISPRLKHHDLPFRAILSLNSAAWGVLIETYISLGLIPSCVQDETSVV